MTYVLSFFDLFVVLFCFAIIWSVHKAFKSLRERRRR